MPIERKTNLAFTTGIVAACAAPLLLPQPAFGQGQTDHVLSVARAETVDDCTRLFVDFNSRIQILSSFPESSGRELHIKLKLLDPISDHNGREALRVPDAAGSLRSIEYDGSDTSGPILSLFFTKDVHFEVAATPKPNIILIRLNDAAAQGACAAPGQRPTPPPGATTAPSSAEMSALLSQGEQSLRDGAFDRAVQQLTNALNQPENADTPRALELLGLARERAGQTDFARSEYEEYLRRYPSGEGADRVRQRLGALPGAGTSTPAPELHQAQERPANGDAWKWGMRGSLSEFYYRDQGRTTTLNTSSDLNQTVDKSVNVNQLMSSADVTITGGNNRRQIQIRAAGSYTKNFGTSASIISINQGTQSLNFTSPPGGGLGSLTALYVDYSDNDLKSSVRIGRQNRNSAGVLGRFDGGLLGIQVNPNLRVNVVGGFPVESSHQLYIKTERPFYGFSVDLGRKRSPVQTTLYWFDQHAPGGFIDRRSVGIEMRVLRKRFNAFALVDYDVKFQRLNLGLITFNYNFPDSSNLSVTADYRQAPLLRTTNALGIQDLNGNRIDDLEGLRPFFTDDQIYQAAKDNTLVTKSVTVNYTRPITRKLQLSADFNMTDTGGSRGVLAPSGISSDPNGFAIAPIPRTGQEYYYGLELIGSGMFQENDIYTISGRYANTAAGRIYTIDANGRIPITSNFRLSPRLRYGIRNDKITSAVPIPGSFRQFQPTLRMNYYPVKHSEIEIEFGGNFSTKKEYSTGSLTTTKESGWVLNAGFRVDF